MCHQLKHGSVSPINSKEEKRGKTALNERAVKTNVLRDKSAAFVFGPGGEKCKVGENNDAIRGKLMAVSHPSATVGEGD